MLHHQRLPRRHMLYGKHVVTPVEYYLKNLHSEGNMLQERIARKFHQLHTKQVNAQFGHMKL